MSNIRPEFRSPKWNVYRLKLDFLSLGSCSTVDVGRRPVLFLNLAADRDFWCVLVVSASGYGADGGVLPASLRA